MLYVFGTPRRTFESVCGATIVSDAETTCLEVEVVKSAGLVEACSQQIVNGVVEVRDAQVVGATLAVHAKRWKLEGAAKGSKGGIVFSRLGDALGNKGIMTTRLYGRDSMGPLGLCSVGGFPNTSWQSCNLDRARQTIRQVSPHSAARLPIQ